MAVVANLCLPGWDELRREMLEKRRRRRRERLRGSLWVQVEVSDQGNVEEDYGEEDDVGSEEEEVSEDKEAEAGEKADEEEEETVMRDEEETEEGGENEAGRQVEEDEEEDNGEAIQAGVRINVDEKEKEEEEENVVGRKVKENKEMDEDEGEEAKKEGELEESEEEENEVEVKEEGEANGREVTKAEETEEGQGEKENEFEREVKEAEAGGENEEENEKDGQARDEEQVEEQTGQFREQLRRTEDENIQQNQEGVKREHETVNEGHMSDSAKSDNEDLTESKEEFYNSDGTKTKEKPCEYPEELEDPEAKSQRNENSILGTRTSKERKAAEGESEMSTGEKQTAAESRTTHDEEFRVDHKRLEREEEESTDDEQAEHSADEEADGEDDDGVKVYRQNDYHTDMFRTLTEFRDSSLLTDLILNTEDGKSFHVHSPVLAAVSIHIQERLSRCNVDTDGLEDASVGVHRWSVSLGPEVDRVGLKAVVEFAYTGLISCLNEDTRRQIKAAAQTLGVPRVLDLCKEETSTNSGGQKKEDVMTSAVEQRMISLQSIKQLWMDGVGCDVILKAVGGSFHVHRVILAVCSDYFRCMFTSGMRESGQPCVTLPVLLASELEVLFDCSYSGDLPLNWKCVFEITAIALQLQYQPALSLCLNFLHREINPHSCLDVASFAEAYGTADLLEVAEDFIPRQFQKVSCVSKFKDLPAQKLLKYLNSQSLCVASELVVFRAVVAWIRAKPKKRLKHAAELMKTIHFSLMTFKEFKEVRSLNMWSDHRLTELYEAVFEDFCSNESVCRIYLPKESLVLIGGDHISEDQGSRSISRELWFGNSLRNHTGIKKAIGWRKLGEMPGPERFSHEVAVLKGQLYVFGGKKYYGISDTLNSAYRYDPLQNSWESLADMQEKRCSFSATVLDGKIYAIGGHRDPEYIQTVERYCPTGNSWSSTRPLDRPLCGHVAKVLRGQIFVSGGQSGDYQYLASMFRYHPETGSTHLADMARPRALHCMESLGERLYVAGGITAGDNVSIFDQLACEAYNPLADSWTAFAPLPVPHVGAAGVVLEGKFYVLGGYSQEDYTDTATVHRYDPATQRWENVGKMPGPNNDIRASVLCLLPHLRL